MFTASKKRAFGEALLASANERLAELLDDHTYQPEHEARVWRPGASRLQRLVRPSAATVIAVVGTVTAVVLVLRAIHQPTIPLKQLVLAMWVLVVSAAVACAVDDPTKPAKLKVTLDRRARVLVEAARDAVRATRASRTPAGLLLRQPLADAHVELLALLANLEDQHTGPGSSVTARSALSLPEFAVPTSGVHVRGDAADAVRISAACLAALWVVESGARLDTLDVSESATPVEQIEAIVRAAHPAH